MAALRKSILPRWRSRVGPAVAYEYQFTKLMHPLVAVAYAVHETASVRIRFPPASARHPKQARPRMVASRCTSGDAAADVDPEIGWTGSLGFQTLDGVPFVHRHDRINGWING